MNFLPPATGPELLDHTPIHGTQRLRIARGNRLPRKIFPLRAASAFSKRGAILPIAEHFPVKRWVFCLFVFHYCLGGGRCHTFFRIVDIHFCLCPFLCIDHGAKGEGVTARQTAAALVDFGLQSSLSCPTKADCHDLLNRLACDIRFALQGLQAAGADGL